MSWQHVYSHDANGQCTYGSLDHLLTLLTEDDAYESGVDVGVKHQFEIIRRFFPVQQVLINAGHIYAVVINRVHNVMPGKGTAITWDPHPEGFVSIYCTDGHEFWNGGKSSVKSALDWYIFTSRIVSKAKLPRQN
jgi:hypothetical protein